MDDQDVNYSLISAVREGRLESVRELINCYGLSYCQEWSEGYVLLCDAIMKEHAAVAKLLLTSGCRVNSKNKMPSYTPLHLAVLINGDTEIVKMILDKGANIDARDTNCQTPLHLAVSCGGDIEIVKMILDKGASIDAKNHLSLSPLHLAVSSHSNIKIVKLILDKGAYIDAKAQDGRTPLHGAIYMQKMEVTELLLKYRADVNTRDNNGQAPLHVATMIGCIEIVKALLQHDADINASDRYGRTALHYTSVSENWFDKDPDRDIKKREIAKQLLSEGANVDAQTKDGVTTLIYAIEKGDAKVVEALLEYNANVNSGVKTPLHLSAYSGHKEIIIMLLNKGADVNAKQEDGTTALHIVTQNGYKEVVTLLLECGADTNSRDLSGRTALHIASSKGHDENVKVLLEHGADINCRDECGRTALHFASQQGHDELVVTLLKYGADINITSRYNDTPLDNVLAEIRSLYRILSTYYHDDEYYDFNCGQLSRCEVTAKTLIRHMVNMKTVNLYVSEKNVLSMSSSDLIGFKYKCEKEIASMKTEKINNLTTSFYDIFAKSTSSLAIYMRNENIVQVLKSDEYKTKFPIYASMIEKKFRKGMERKELLEQGYKIYHFLFNNFPELPYNCTEKIFSYLSDADLRILLDAYKPLVICNLNTTINDVPSDYLKYISNNVQVMEE